ncbi:MAG: hypothetical protein WBP79_09415 [Candidatus Acidiferrales bacterium]
MRISRRKSWIAVLLAGVSLAGASQAAAQEQETTVLMPEQSAAKAKQLLQQAIEALGGKAYLGVRDVTCKGRLSQFGHSGALSGFETFEDYAIPPDKDRNENLPKRNLIEVFNGDKGWVLDRGGVSDAPADTLAQVREDTKKDIDNILRNRMKEPGMIFRYAGTDVVDLKEVDWVELVDNDNRTIRIALAKATHLPIRKTVITRDPNTRLRSEEIEYYSNYHPIDGVMTPFQITRERNGMKVYQVFFDKCDYNTNISDSLFTRESLDERWQKVGKKQINKKNKSNSSSSGSKNN